MLHKLWIITFVVINMTTFVDAQNQEVALWNTSIPGAIASETYIESYDVSLDQVRNVKIPTLKIFVPENPNGTAMIICPGGGYALLAIKRSGYDVAKWLNKLGITAFVLKYRLPSDEIMQDKSIGPLQDAQESIRYVRRNAKKWQLNPNKIGVIGFSAGGHLASTLATHYKDVTYKTKDTTSAKPDFTVLVYPVISMQDNTTHKGSRNRLLGNKPSKEVIEKFSNQLQVNSHTSPTFIAHASDDKDVTIKNSIAYYLALKENNVPAELHAYQNGKHAFFLGRENTTSQYWTSQCKNWLFLNNYIN
ncbi:alpha/beta hydrolase [Polaribacter atrinae]|uniref:alpha/beta hydrolase n=1 Tax=Polaribacter atrinae TaxID=1333662 RepID=UPI0024939187|nr:alpha/beta hydrolase [Polaribacter atrinae]